MTNSDVLSEILRQYGAALKANPQLRSLALKAANGSLTVAEAQRAAGLTGKLLGELMADGLGGLAGDGALALTDALAVVPPSLRRNHKFVSSLIRGLEKDGELSTAVPAFDADRARNLAKYASEFEKFEDHKLDFKELVENNSRSIVDESQEQTAQARYEMGYTPTISRSTVGETCDWCNGLAGTREYNPQTMSRDIFARHRNCDCLIELNRNGGTEVVNNYSRRNDDTGAKRIKRRQDVSEKASKNVKGEQIASSLITNLRDEKVIRSVGAKGENYDIMDLATGDIYHLADGSKLQNKEVFAGKGTRVPYRNAWKYANKWGGKVDDWQHVKGIGELDTPEGTRKAEIHWSQCEGIGKKDMNIKEWLE